MNITKIQKQKKRKNRYNIFVDNEYAFSINESDLLNERVIKGPIDKFSLEELHNKALIGILYEYSIEHEARRPHSLFEHKKYLYKKANAIEIPTEKRATLIDKAITKLVNSKYQSDELFTQWFIKQRINSSKPKGKSFITAELIKKGVSKEIIKNNIESMIDKDIEIKNAQSLANKKIHLLKNGRKKLSNDEIKQKTTQFLISRGYNYNVIKCLQLI